MQAMSGWLPPGCADKDVDDAANGDPETFLDMRREAIWIERTMHEIQSNCDEMVGKGYGDELKALLDMIRDEHWKELRGK